MGSLTMALHNPLRTIVLSGLAGCLLFSGCELTRPNFQMNSNSHMPFFGIDLLPRRSTTLVDPPSATKPLETAASSGEVRTASEIAPQSQSRSRFWNSFSLPSSRHEPTVIPLASPAADHPINRGPVELLP